jgi:hypothetical protein
MPEIKELATVIKEHAIMEAELKGLMVARQRNEDARQEAAAPEAGAKSGLPTQDAIDAFFAMARGSKRAAKVSASHIVDDLSLVGDSARRQAAPHATPGWIGEGPEPQPALPRERGRRLRYL